MKFINFKYLIVILFILLYLLNALYIVYNTIIISTFIIIGICLAIKMNGKQLMAIHTPEVMQPLLKKESYDKSLTNSIEDNYFESRTLVSQSIDPLIEQIIDLFLRDFVYIWYETIANKSEDQYFKINLKNEIWQTFARILVRMRSIDSLKLFATNIVNRCQKHFQKITICINSKDGHNYYPLSSHLKSDESEIAFLRKLSDLLLTILLPKPYYKTKPLHHLLEEILAVQLFYKCISLICDPHYLNLKLLNYLKWQRNEFERHRQTYAYTETFEEFIKMINNCYDVEDLKRIRFQIITEIMQATAINNLKRERGIDVNKEMFSRKISLAKGDLLQARNLKRYINQLSFAKSQCEKKISISDPNTSIHSDSYQLLSSDSSSLSNKKTILAFKVIMNSALCRTYLKKFMQYSLRSSLTTAETRRYLIVFWESVEELRKHSNEKQYEIAIEILNHPNFISSVVNLINLPKVLLKGMEEFILGNRGPNSFYSAQSFVFDALENRYYPLFIVSTEYYEMMEHYEDSLEHSFESQIVDKVYECSLTLSANEDCFDISSDNTIDGHLSQTKLKLDVLKDKLKDKSQALNILKRQKIDSETPLSHNINVNAKLINLLDKEIDDITREYKKLENHLNCTKLWLKGIGKWTTEVHNIELDINNIESGYLVIIIIFNENNSHLSVDENSLNGWVITRTQNEFSEFRRNLVKKYSTLKKYEFPKLSNKSAKFKESQLKIIRKHLQDFLNALTSNDVICKSEELYLFLSQSSNHLRLPLSVQMQQTKSKSAKFPFANLFGITYANASKNLPQEYNSDELDEQTDTQFLIIDDLEGKESSKDDIAEPLYDLISEIFDLRGVFNWLRRTLITFVQVTYGQTINKQLRLTVEWICSESMLHYYLTSFRDSLWPNGILTNPWPEPCDSEIKRTRVLAKQHLLNSIPELITNLLGHQNSKKGIAKVFDGLQNKQLNKQLCYELIETFMFEFAPELKNG